MPNCNIVYVFVGLAQYSGDPRIEWHLNTFSTKDAVIDAVKNLPYKGGNTLTGVSLISLKLPVYLAPNSLGGSVFLIHVFSLRLSFQALH